MKLFQDEVYSKDKKAIVAILIAFLLAAILLALGIVYLLNFLLASVQS